MFTMYDKDKSGTLEYKVGRQWGLSICESICNKSSSSGERGGESARVSR